MPPRDAAAEPEAVALARDALVRGQAALAASDRGTALRWFDRAHRLLPSDPNAMLSVASLCVGTDPERAAGLFAAVANRYDIRQAWIGLAAARLRLNGSDDPADALSVALSHHIYQPDIAALADQIAAAGGRPGWCALTQGGTLEIRAAAGQPVLVSIDGRPVRGTQLPESWPGSRLIEVSSAGVPLLGSPIQIQAIRRVSGCVEVVDGGLSGWAWHPGNPLHPAELTLFYTNGGLTQTIAATDESSPVPDTGPLAHARRFRLSRTDLLDAPGPIHVRRPDGGDLPGSPLDPFAEERARIAAALHLGRVYSAGTPGRARRNADDPAEAGWTLALHADGTGAPQPEGATGRRRDTTVVIPVHNGGDVALNCLTSVLESMPPDARVLVIDDGSAEPGLVAALGILAREKKIKLLRHDRPRGFAASANEGIRAAAGRDVILLNSDTLVPPGWIERLRHAAYSSRDIGTVTPLSNDASILSYPGDAGRNPIPGQTETNRLDRLAVRANGGTVVDIPVGVGFCLFLRRDCLEATGALRADIFAQGYGEENDLCLRARVLGWRNVALAGLFVAHVGGSSFGAAAIHLRSRNEKILERLHPGQESLVRDYVARDPLAEPRRRIDLLRWRETGKKWRESAILITHDHGGGVEKRLTQSIREHIAAGRRPIVLRPAKTAGREPAIAVRDGAGGDFPNLVYAIPVEYAALLRLLRSAGPVRTEVHHFLDHPPSIHDVVRDIGVPYEVFVHDYAWFCPRVSLVGTHDRYCGEPAEAECEACVADNGHFMAEDISIAALRQRSSDFLAAAQRVIAPSDDAAQRMRRHFPGLEPVTIPHEDDAATLRRIRQNPAAAPAERARVLGAGRARVCIVGAIGVHKGYKILLACARDAANRNLNLEFVVAGHTIDDARLMATGRVFITGGFSAGEAVDLIAAQGARLGFVTSIWPETWCLSLGEIWRAGLFAAAFDIGAPAERIKQSGYGILLPLGLSPGAINNTLIAAIGSLTYG